MPKNMMTNHASTAAAAPNRIEPATSHAPPPTSPAPTVAPPTLPKTRRRMPPSAGTTRKKKITQAKGTSIDCGPGLRWATGGSGSPLPMTPMMRSTPALMPAANWFCRNSGVIVSAMMRLDVASVSTPSKP